MKNLSEYSFERTIINYASNEMLERIFHKPIKYIEELANNNLKEIYDTIKTFYDDSSDEGINELVLELRKLEEADDIKELLFDLKEFQDTSKVMKLDKDVFVRMLEYCKIEVPKWYYKLDYVRNDKCVRAYSQSKRLYNATFDAIDKLLTYEIA